jgi:hypothetical protein
LPGVLLAKRNGRTSDQSFMIGTGVSAVNFADRRLASTPIRGKASPAE